jgi:hypothetical protein
MIATDNLYSVDFLNGKRRTGDLPADEFTNRIFNDDATKKELRAFLTGLVYNSQLTQLPTQYKNEPVFTQANQLPHWANIKMMQIGHAFFARHANLIMNMLGLLSLPYCYAAADGARVLYLSERIRNDTAKRLQETGDFVWDVMAPNAFTPEGKGFASILKVRLIHAAVRYYTLQSGQWNSDWGVPVNQEDMAGTNLSFSMLVIRGLRKLDIAVSNPDQQAFMHLWNVIGYLSGLEQSLIPQDGKQGIALERAISSHQFKPSEQGQALTKALVDYFAGLSLPAPFNGKETIQLMRFLIGDEIADILALPVGEVPGTIINLLKINGTWQELKPQPSASEAYYQQYADCRKQQRGA